MSRAGSRRRTALIIAIAVAVPACGDLVDEVRGRLGLDAMPASEPTGPAYLAFDLPLGVSVAVDGKELGVNPVEPIELPPGEHEVTASHSCKRNASAKFVVVAGETTTVTIDAFTLLAATDLHLAISSLNGEPLAPKLRIGRFYDQASVGESEHAIPADGWVKLLACPQRIIVTSGNPAIGGYWEDIRMAAPKALGRKIVLAPGPDMVRLEGGSFTTGMRTQMLRELDAFNNRPVIEEGEGANVTLVPQREVVIEPFEIDRHPVTAVQFEACWNSGACRDERLEGFSGFGEERSCAASISYDQESRDWTRIAMASRTLYPMNCIARWEAEKYCRSVGKRLPSTDEWEYAARSGDEHWDCAPGLAVGDCAGRFAHGGYDSDIWQGRDPVVCRTIADITEQGVCDFGHFSEWVANQAARPGIPECRQHNGPTRGSGGAAWDIESCAPIYRREWDVAFRCARSDSVTAN